MHRHSASLASLRRAILGRPCVIEDFSDCPKAARLSLKSGEVERAAPSDIAWEDGWPSMSYLVGFFFIKLSVHHLLIRSLDWGRLSPSDLSVSRRSGGRLIPVVPWYKIPLGLCVRFRS